MLLGGSLPFLMINLVLRSCIAFNVYRFDSCLIACIKFHNFVYSFFRVVSELSQKDDVDRRNRSSSLLNLSALNVEDHHLIGVHENTFQKENRIPNSNHSSAKNLLKEPKPPLIIG